LGTYGFLNKQNDHWVEIQSFRAKEFDAHIGDQITKGQLDARQSFLKMGELAKIAHPTYEHFFPLLNAAGAAKPTEMPRFLNTGFQAGSISMRSVLWG
jgi:4,5-DOPA dioxygenase extradiol